MVLNSDYLASALLGVGENGFPVDRFDGERIHQPNIDTFTGCKKSVNPNPSQAENHCYSVMFCEF